MRELKAVKGSRRDQEGQFLALTAVVAAVVLSTFVLLGVNTFLVRQASRSLREFTNNICRAAIGNDLLLQSQVQGRFAQAVHDIEELPPFGRLQLTRATLILPEMPPQASTNTRAFDLANCVDNTPDHVLACTPIEGCNPETSQFAADFACNMLNKVSAANAGEVSGRATCIAGNATAEWLYPENLWNDVDNLGNMIGCELHAEVDLYPPLGKRTITARSAVGTPLLSAHPAYTDCVVNNDTDPSEVYGAMPGLSIAIAPHVTTDSRLGRYRVRGGQSGALDIYDPLAQYDPAAPPTPGFSKLTSVSLIPTPAGTPAPAPSGPPVPTPTPLTMEVPAKISSLRKSEEWPYPPTPTPADGADPGDWATGTGTVRAPAANPPILSDHEEMLTACTNPLVLVRNTLLATLVELATRNGQTRASTEILLAGTQHLVSPYSIPTGDDTVAGGSGVPMNGPTIIVPMGSDLLFRNYQLPYVYYFDDTKNGWMRPFTGFRPWSLHQALIAGQLRYCHHLYSGGAGRIIRRAIGYHALNDDAEPDAYQEVQNPANGTEGYGRWDQCFEAQACYSTAAEAVAMLGTVQACPYEQSSLPGGLTCQKAAARALRPDVLGLFHYLTGSTPAAQLPVPAYAAPGLVPPAAEGASPPQAHSGASPIMSSYWVSPAKTNSAIIFVTHQPLLPAEATYLHNICFNNPAVLDGRAVIVVHIAANRAGSSGQEDTIIANFQDAFCMDPASTAPADNLRQFYSLNPFNRFIPDTEKPASCATGPNGETYGSVNEDNCLYDYWVNQLLNPNPDQGRYIGDIAREIYDALMYKVDKL